MEWYICKHSEIYYQEENFFDAVGSGTWTETKKVPFECQITLFANDKIRVCYFTKMTELPPAIFTNSNPEMAARSGIGKLTIPEEEMGLQTFTRSNSFR